MTSSDLTLCNECKRVAQPDVGGERVPCPHCGSVARAFGVSITENVSATDHFSMIQSRDSEEIGFGESERFNGVSAHATLDDGQLTQGALGPGSYNEGDTLETCVRLARFLNKRGGSWTNHRTGSADVDCIFDGTTGELLSIQVVRAVVDPTFWTTLSKTEEATLEEDVPDAASLMWEAICKKKSIPVSQRASLVLVLDANRTPGLAFQRVVNAFIEQHGDEAKLLGFKEIYVVGPSDDLVKRLTKQN